MVVLMTDRQNTAMSLGKDADVVALLLNTSKIRSGRVTKIRKAAADRITCLANEVAQLSVLVATDAARDLLAERQRQKLADGWTPETDVSRASCEHLVDVAVSYLVQGLSKDSAFDFSDWLSVDDDDSWVKQKLSREDLVRAGTIILAEIERYDRDRRKDDDPTKRQRLFARERLK